MFAFLTFVDDKSLASDENNTKKTHLLTNWPKNLCRSPIWDEKIREEVKTTKISEADLNKKRSEKLDIGKNLEVGTALVQCFGLCNPPIPCLIYSYVIFVATTVRKT